MSDSVSQRYVGPAITRAISVWGLLVLLIVLLIVFSLLRPDTFPTLLQHQVDPQQQIGAGAARARRVHSDDRQSFRSVGGIQSRHFAGAGDRPAGPGTAVVGGGHRRAADGRAGRLGQWRAGHAGQDRFVHRDARHRDGALRPQRLVHRRPAGSRRSAAAVPRHFRQPRPRAAARAVYAGRQPRSVDRVRISPARPLSLRPRREPARRGIERHHRRGAT